LLIAYKNTAFVLYCPIIRRFKLNKYPFPKKIHKLRMPLTRILHPDSKTRIALWNVTETLEVLKDKMILEEHYQDALEIRQKEVLSVRCLLKNLLGADFKGLSYDEHRKPALIDCNQELSISHSKNWVAVLLHEDKRVGLDLELISPRIAKLQRKFMDNTELVEIGEDLVKTTLVWSAKEAMYKYYGRKLLDFKHHLFVQDVPNQRKGSFKGWIHKDEYQAHFQVQYVRFDDFVLTYVVGD